MSRLRRLGAIAPAVEARQPRRLPAPSRGPAEAAVPERPGQAADDPAEGLAVVVVAAVPAAAVPAVEAQALVASAEALRAELAVVRAAGVP